MDRSPEERVELKAVLDRLDEAVAALGRSIQKLASAAPSTLEKSEANKERVERLFGCDAPSVSMLEQSNTRPFDDDLGQKTHGLADHLVRLEDRMGDLLPTDSE